MGERLYRLLLRLYPRAFRDRYGDQMVAVFREERAAAHGILAGARFWVRMVTDLGAAVPEAHRRTRGGMIDDVRRSASTRLGGVMEGMWRDFRFALRTLRRAPAFTVLASPP